MGCGCPACIDLEGRDLRGFSLLLPGTARNQEQICRPSPDFTWIPKRVLFGGVSSAIHGSLGSVSCGVPRGSANFGPSVGGDEVVEAILHLEVPALLSPKKVVHTPLILTLLTVWRPNLAKPRCLKKRAEMGGGTLRPWPNEDSAVKLFGHCTRHG